MRYWQLQEFTSVLNNTVQDNTNIWRAESLSSAKQRKLKDLEIENLSLLLKLCNLLCHSLNIDSLQDADTIREKLRSVLINFVNFKTAGKPLAIPQEILSILQKDTPKDFVAAKKLIEQVNSNSKKINKLLSAPLEANRYYSLEESATVYFNTHLKVTPNNAEVKEKMTNYFIEGFVKNNSLTDRPLRIHKKELEDYIANLPDPFTGRPKIKKTSAIGQQNGFFLSQRSSLGRSIVHTITPSGRKSPASKKRA